jgi:alkanesulfonate monooxygenase SsuD/methylene tetrahydromethanopterin reductase-like flavin-dependent oxidoreductase (luciferase family)
VAAKPGMSGLRVGIGLPNANLGEPTGALLLDLIRRAEDVGLAFVSVRDRHAYQSYEPLTLLAVAAGLTTRIDLVTNIVLAASRQPVLLAKEAATIHELSNGRLILGLGVGERADDFEIVGSNFADRGRRFDETLETLHRVWAGEDLVGSGRAAVPEVFVGRTVPVMIGGTVERNIERTVKWGIGWTMSRLPTMYTDFIAKLRTAWHDAGRPGEPRLGAVLTYGLGPDGDDAVRAHFADYLGYTGRDGEFWRANPRSADAVRETLIAYREAGITDLQMKPAILELGQVDELANIVEDVFKPAKHGVV